MSELFVTEIFSDLVDEDIYESAPASPMLYEELMETIQTENVDFLLDDIFSEDDATPASSPLPAFALDPLFHLPIDEEEVPMYSNIKSESQQTTPTTSVYDEEETPMTSPVFLGDCDDEEFTLDPCDLPAMTACYDYAAPSTTYQCYDSYEYYEIQPKIETKSGISLRAKRKVRTNFSDDEDEEDDMDGSEDGDISPRSCSQSKKKRTHGTSSESESKRTAHNVLERRRRDDLKVSFNELRSSIPSLEYNERCPKMNILQKASELVYELRAKDANLAAQKEKAIAERNRLLARLESLQRSKQNRQ